MSRPKIADIGGLIGGLIDRKVRFIVVGGAAAVLHGAPITTQDLDIVPQQSAGNLDRLMEFLSDHDALVRDLAGRQLRPERSNLAGKGQLNLVTDLGPIDLLCRLHDGRGYDQLSEHIVQLTDGTRTIDVLNLVELIQIKQSTGRERDRLVVPILLALLRHDR